MPNKINNISSRYTETIYGFSERPITYYPSKLIKHLINRFNLSPSSSLLDVGCGRGDFVNEFSLRGFYCTGVDASDLITSTFPNIPFVCSDLESDPLPFPPNSFDIVFSKSVIEHFYSPDKLFSEINRILKPGGVVITLVPSWEYCFRNYFEDYTHRTPFMMQSLNDIHRIHGFSNVSVNFFRQLPILWGKYSLLFYPLSEITRMLAPISLSKKYKWVRFSKEIMLLSFATKPF